jgi:hypothetical protein
MVISFLLENLWKRISTEGLSVPTLLPGRCVWYKLQTYCTTVRYLLRFFLQSITCVSASQSEPPAPSTSSSTDPSFTFHLSVGPPFLFLYIPRVHPQ